MTGVLMDTDAWLYEIADRLDDPTLHPTVKAKLILVIELLEALQYTIFDLDPNA